MANVRSLDAQGYHNEGGACGARSACLMSFLLPGGTLHRKLHVLPCACLGAMHPLSSHIPGIDAVQLINVGAGPLSLGQGVEGGWG